MEVEIVPIGWLKPHPQNYNEHPEDEIEHLRESIRENGIYRNIVVAKDYTVLAGHGVTIAAREEGLTEVPVHRLDLAPNSPRALKVLAADNEISHLSMKDDRKLSEILKAIKEQDEVGLLGTGYDERMLANLIFVTRPASEIEDFNAAQEWVGMPEYEMIPEARKVTVSFRNDDDRAAFFNRLGIPFTDKTKSTWYPYREKEDVSSVRFVRGEEEDENDT